MSVLPHSLQRLAVEVEGWIDLGCAAEALARVGPLLEHPVGRPLGLALQARALVARQEHAAALGALTALRGLPHDAEWLELTEAWCRKRVGDLPGAVACMERLLERQPRAPIGHYNLGCYLALLGDTERALREVTIACGMDADLRGSLAGERDLDSLRADPRFQSLLPPPAQAGE